MDNLSMNTLYFGMTANEIINMKEKVKAADGLVDALREIGSANWHFSMSRKIANEALANYEKLSEENK